MPSQRTRSASVTAMGGGGDRCPRRTASNDTDCTDYPSDAEDDAPRCDTVSAAAAAAKSESDDDEDDAGGTEASGGAGAGAGAGAGGGGGGGDDDVVVVHPAAANKMTGASGIVHCYTNAEVTKMRPPKLKEILEDIGELGSVAKRTATLMRPRVRELVAYNPRSIDYTPGEQRAVELNKVRRTLATTTA